MPQMQHANGTMPAVVIYHSSRDGFLKKPGTDETLRFVQALSATSTACLVVCSPDVTRTCIASRFAPGKLRASPVVDVHPFLRTVLPNEMAPGHPWDILECTPCYLYVNVELAMIGLLRSRATPSHEQKQPTFTALK
jgi:hypothetical protein